MSPPGSKPNTTPPTPARSVHRLDAIRQPLGRRLSRFAAGLLDDVSRRLVLGVLAGVERGRIEIVEGEQVHGFGTPCDALPGVARIEVHDPRFYTAVALGGILASGESFMEADWSCDELPLLVHILLENEEARQRFDGPAVRVAKQVRRLWEATRTNTRRGSRRNIEAHYDLGNAFFEAFLDPTLTYSCGIFESPDATMEMASVAKYDRLCRMVDLRADDHLVEIGCGWGGFALHAASRYGCRVTSTTISQEQYDLARERVAEAGLSDRVEIVLRKDDQRPGIRERAVPGASDRPGIDQRDLRAGRTVTLRAQRGQQPARARADHENVGSDERVVHHGRGRFFTTGNTSTIRSGQ